MAELLARILRRDRRVVGIALILLAALSWAYILAGAGMGMSGLEMTRHSSMGMDMMPKGAWDLDFIVLMFLMWWIMMIAMMLPSATPMILLAAALNRKSDSGHHPFGSTGAFTLGYLLAWAGFSAIAVAAQWALQESALISGMLRSTSANLSAFLLLAAGTWQFMPWKHACLRHCRSPVEFLVHHRRKGNAGALWMGFHHGLYCLGCCWFLMALLFVGGVMNLYWILGLAIYVWMEKILPQGERMAGVLGAILILWGLLIITGMI